MSKPVRRWGDRAWQLSLCLFVVYSAGLAWATAADAGLLTRLLRQTPPEVAQDIIVRHARDDEGRRASFRILLLTDDYRWQLSSVASVHGSSAEPEFTPEMGRLLNSAREIIAVGASSEEIVPGLEGAEARLREEARAARRARQVAAWIEPALTRPVPIRLLNVGHHRPTPGVDDTADQRRVVIILVLEQEEAIDLDRALRDAMTRPAGNPPIFEALLTQYSLGSRDRFTWVAQQP